VKFGKAHGLGNDFIMVAQEVTPAEPAAWVRRLCERHEGIGGDGVLVYRLDGERVHMRLYNADGTDGEMSGNGARCLAAYMVHRGWMPRTHVVQATPGPRPVEVAALDATRYRVLTDLGPALLSSAQIPVNLPALETVVDVPVDVAGGTVRITATSLGNPHCAVFMETPPDDTLLAALGAPLERHPLFPKRTNVEFVHVLSPHELRVRFWERGVGYTRASGTGAASAAVAAILNGRAESPVRVVCDGGTLEVEWPGSGNVRQIGEVELLFEGDWLG
jgi:diaminopimelate epimerase